MNYGAIKQKDIANGIGVRVSLFVSGCRNACPECFNRETWAFDYGQPFDEEARALIFGELSLPYVDGLSVLGGEPFEPENQAVLAPFLRECRARFPGKSIWCYTGCLFDTELMREGSRVHTADTLPMLQTLDILVDGRYVSALHDITLQFRGSSNQRVIDVPRTLQSGEIVIWNQLRK